MNDFLKMDIFFAVSTLAVIVLTVLLSVVILRVLRILGKVESLTAMVSEEGEQLRADIASVREHVREEGLRVGQVLGFLTGFSKPKKRTRQSKDS